MASNRPTLSSLLSSSDPKGRRRRISLSKSTPNLHTSNSELSPDAIPNQTAPIRTEANWAFASGSNEELEHRNNDMISTAISQSRSSSRSGSSASSTSSTDSEYYPPSPPSAGLTRSPTKSAANLLTAAILSSRMHSHHSLPGSLSSAHLTNFAPPFYNRPPTPLPASPSLTSLLRPSFSATPSHPTTPDDSEVEQQTTNLSLAHSSTTTATTNRTNFLTTAARTAPTLPRASPKVPTYEYYGFVLYLTSSLCFLGYVLWSYLPSPFLHQLRIYYYPDRWWSLALPAWIVMAVIFVYVGLAGYNLEILTLPLGSLGVVVDEVSVIAAVDGRTGRLKVGRKERMGDGDGDEERPFRWRDCWSEGTDAVLDVPIGGVCEVLYGEAS